MISTDRERSKEDAGPQGTMKWIEGDGRLDWQHMEFIGGNRKMTIPDKAGIHGYLGIFSAEKCERRNGCAELAIGLDGDFAEKRGEGRYSGSSPSQSPREGLSNGWAAR